MNYCFPVSFPCQTWLHVGFFKNCLIGISHERALGLVTCFENPNKFLCSIPCIKSNAKIQSHLTISKYIAKILIPIDAFSRDYKILTFLRKIELFIYHSEFKFKFPWVVVSCCRKWSEIHFNVTGYSCPHSFTLVLL